ncbi:N-acetyllactosaminide beta-1,3-N-acetylglucosaminyltransferase [Aphelenchoides besseyi]|nr:N-acetyllactosaminide beta-1,3-N-acetylglucosaminyltransferase [Aphelenchoides besseyi]
MPMLLKTWVATFLLGLSTIGLLFGVVHDNSSYSLSTFHGAKTHSPTLQQTARSIAYNSDYCVIYDYWRSHPRFNKTISLVLHATSEYLSYLEEHARLWDGAVSIAIFIPPTNQGGHPVKGIENELTRVVSLIKNLKRAKKGEKFSIHFFFEKRNLTKCPELKLKFNETKGQKLPFIYPINTARNIARLGMKTRLFLSGDVEQLFSKNYEPRMRALASKILLKEKQKLVLVHRRFELDKGIKVPETKAELKKLYDEKKAVEFHRHFYYRGHKIAKINEWFQLPENLTTTKIFSILNYTNAEWEPQFVGSSEVVPLHDEKFPFRLRSNTHLATELCRSGFRFAVVTDLFTAHRGIKRKESLKELESKKAAKEKGYLKHVMEFKARLNEKYPKTKSICPKFLP